MSTEIGSVIDGSGSGASDTDTGSYDIPTLVHTNTYTISHYY